ncbi:Formin-like protein 15 [Hordeum vulgare]|nr:Formin-like protein 15 [Hordeum vulgare]
MTNAHPNFGGSAVDQPGMAKKKKAKAPRKPRAERTPEEIAKLDAESVKRRNRRAVVKDNDAARKFAAERDAMEAARRKAKVEEKEAIVNKAHTLLMLGIFVRPSPTSRTTAVSPGFPPPRHDAHTRFLGSPDVSVIAPSTPRPSAYIDLNVTPGSSSGGGPSVEMQRKQARPPFAGTMPSPRVLFDEMATPMAPVDNTYYAHFMEDVIYNGGRVPAYDPDETQSQDGHAQFVADEEADDRADYDHGDSWHGDDDIY